MKILVFSDTHGIPSTMLRAVKEHLDAGTVDMLVHLGDGKRDFEKITAKYPDISAVSVAGNCDLYAFDSQTECLFSAGGLTFLAVHGHRLHVNEDLQYAVDYAAQKGADVLLYGHTHRKADEVMTASNGKTVRTINPGTSGLGYIATYAVLNIVNGQMVCGFSDPQ